MRTLKHSESGKGPGAGVYLAMLCVAAAIGVFLGTRGTRQASQSPSLPGPMVETLEQAPEIPSHSLPVHKTKDQTPAPTRIAPPPPPAVDQTVSPLKTPPVSAPPPTSIATSRTQEKLPPRPLAAPEQADIDAFGGMKSLPANQGASGFFRTEKINGKWWFVTPGNHALFLTGVGNTPEGDLPTALRTFDKTAQDSSQDDMFRAFHFRTQLRPAVGKGTEPLSSLPFVLSIPFFDENTPLPDVFDPNFAKQVDETASRICGKWKNHPALVGYLFAGEKVWAGLVQKPKDKKDSEETEKEDTAKTPKYRFPWVSDILNKNGHTPGKQAFADLMAKRYKGRIFHFNGRYKTNFSNFKSIAKSDLVSEMEKLTDDDMEAFLLEIAKAFFRTTGQAIQRHDPNHMILGSALAGGGPYCHTDELIQAAGEYCNVISGDFDFNKTDCDVHLARLKRWHDLTGKPVLISAFVLPNTFYEPPQIAYLEKSTALPFVTGYLLRFTGKDTGILTMLASQGASPYARTIISANAKSTAIHKEAQESRILAEASSRIEEVPDFNIAVKKPSIKSRGPVFVPKTVLGVHNLFFGWSEYITAINAKATRRIIDDRTIKSWFSDSKKKSRIVSYMQTCRNQEIQVILSIRWPNWENKKRKAMENKPHDDRVPVGKDREESLALLDRFLNEFGPYMDWYSFQNEAVAGNGEYPDHLKKDSKGNSPACEWFATLAEHTRELMKENPKLSHLKFMSPALTTVNNQANGAHSLNTWFIEQIIEMSNEHMDAIDVHFHDVVTPEDTRKSIKWVKRKAKIPLASTEWAPTRAGEEWLKSPVADERFGKDIVNGQFIQNTYKKPVSIELWNEFMATVPLDPAVFIEKQYKVCNEEGMVVLCYGGGGQIGKPQFDWKQLIATRTVKGKNQHNQLYYDAFAAFAKKIKKTP